MNTKDIVAWLRHRDVCPQDDILKRGMIVAADKIEELEAELKAEMHRHDRLQDFEVAEAEELARAKALCTAMAGALKISGGCGNCKHCYSAWDEEPCDSCRQDPGFPQWEWNGIIRGGVSADGN